jgi:hypothetical protein
VAEAGHLLLPQGPGLSFRFDEAAVQKYGVVYAGSSDYWVSVQGAATLFTGAR